MDMTREEKREAAKQYPMAHARAVDIQPLDKAGVLDRMKPYIGKSLAHLYQGPGWVNDLGIACIVLLASDDRTPKRLRQESKCAFMAWRWNVTPSTPLSLTIVMGGSTPTPVARWIRDDLDPVVQAIRREGRFLVAVGHPGGQISGWFEAVFSDGIHDGAPPSKKALERLWTFPVSGIPRSCIGVPFDPQQSTAFNDEGTNEIPLYPETVSDYWRTLDGTGPWMNDLTSQDKAQAAWGLQAYRKRYQAAGRLQVIKDRQHAGDWPIFDAAGRLQKDGPAQDALAGLVTSHPLIGQLLAALAGPAPDARQSLNLAVAILHESSSAMVALMDTWLALPDVDAEPLWNAYRTCFEAAFVDARVTRAGTCRPWLANAGRPGELELRAMPVNLGAPLEDIRILWRDGMELIDLIDMGKRLTGDDFPMSVVEVCTALEVVRIDGTLEAVDARINELLHEAQEARQWSIPWGARVEVRFGPFVALRIFEDSGEFSCYFLDAQDRYFHVAVGLQHNPPKIATHLLFRLSDDDGTHIDNEDAEISLKLIAAATVRDFLVVEDRESVFTARPFKRRIRGRDVRTVIYLPRVRYTALHPNRLPQDEEGHRARHHVSAHLRRAKEASTAQRFLAQRHGIWLPEGFTFVRPHERGGVVEAERVKVYRSRSASRMIFDVVDTAPQGTRPAWFDFEKDCAHLLTGRGMKVVHQAATRDGDGGVDLFAVDDGGKSWVVQCKCWAAHRAVGPEIVRELEGAIRLADKGSGTVSKGMIITTSSFTSGAASAAVALGFVLVDGTALVKMLAIQNIKTI